jgi:hypothetical protein
VKSERKFPRKNRWATAIVAIMALLAVVMGPLCTPICSATFCAMRTSEAAENDGCHGSGTHQNDGAEGSLAAFKTCRAGDIAAILSNLGEKKQFSPVTRNTPATLLFTTNSSPLLEAKTTNWPRCCDRSSPLRQANVSLQTTNLRI